MTDKEKEVFRIIYENDNPEQAFLTAVETICAFLEQHESFEGQVPVCLQAQV